MPDNKQSDPSAAAKNNSCSICRANGVPPPCKGHGGQGGGDDSGDKVSKSDNQAPANVQGQLIHAADQVANTVIQVIDARYLSQQPQLTFNPEVISELLSKKLLLIDNDRDSGILIIKLKCNPSMLSEAQRNELKKFIDSILKELDELKKEKGISSNCATIDKDNEGNFLSLRITLPTPTVYDEFVQRLADKNLLPMQNVAEKNYGASKKEENPSSIRPRSPLDGLKPKGWA